MDDLQFELPERNGISAEDWIDLLCDKYSESLDNGRAVDPLDIVSSAPEVLRVPVMQALVDTEADRAGYTGELPSRWDRLRTSPMLGPILALVVNARDQVNRYHIQSLLGSGGFGIVYKARDKILGRDVAIKVVRGSEQLIDRVYEEARFLASLRHPFVLQVLTTVRPNEQQVWIVTPFFANGTLRSLCEKQPIGIDDSLRLTAEIVQALQYLHTQGIYHRDIKPENVLIDDDGHAVLADFGLAILSDQRHQAVGAGTRSYQAPEQIEGSTSGIDGRADLWSVGVLLYKLLTHSLPFNGQDDHDLKRQIQAGHPKPMEETGQRIPRSLQAVCFKLLQKDPKKRYATAKDLHQALRREMNLRWLRSRSRLLSLAGTFLAVLLSYIAYRFFNFDDISSAAPTTSFQIQQKNIAVAFEEPKPIQVLIESGQVKVAQVTVDSRKCIYVQHVWRPGLPIYNARQRGTYEIKDGKTVETIQAFGRVFSSSQERDEYEPIYRANTNPLIYQAVEVFGYDPGFIARAFAFEEDKRPEPVPDEQKWPVLLASISNNSGQPVVIGNCTLNVLRSAALKSFDRSEVLEPKAQVTVRVYPQVGHYSSALVPPLKIAPKDSVSVEVQLLPGKEAPNYFGYILACELIFAVDEGSITSEPFLLRFNGISL
jgi:serine/threonine protein kinase